MMTLTIFGHLVSTHATYQGNNPIVDGYEPSTFHFLLRRTDLPSLRKVWFKHKLNEGKIRDDKHGVAKLERRVFVPSRIDTVRTFYLESMVSVTV